MFNIELLPEPDDNGVFSHPDIPYSFMEWDDFFPNCGFNIKFVRFLDEFPEYGYYKDPNKPLYFDSSKCSWEKRTDLMKHWNPPVPDGDNWQIISKHWCEWGPTAFFAQPKNLQNKKKINHRYIIED